MKIQSNKSIFFYFLLLAIYLSACKSTPTPATSPFQIHDEVSIKEIQTAYKNGTQTITGVTQFYLNRIQKIDQSGIALNAVLTVNPDALTIAKKLDKEYQENKIRGPLHGIPVLLKDNIDTADKMPCTAGARAMKDSYPKEDSPLAAQLRAAGAVILGKANLSEWANFHSDISSSGWSGLGGQTKNPYLLSHNPCGSSAGSGAGVAANLCVFAIGTETNGSIICPSNNNGIVGIKPTVGLISRTGIIPISFHQDTGGPMARSVEDAVIVLGTMTAADSRDEKTLQAGRKALKDYTPHLKKDGIQGKRIGYYSMPLKEDSSGLNEVMLQTIADFKKLGAEIIEIDSILPAKTGYNSFVAMQYDFKHGVNQYLENLGDRATVKNLQEIIDLSFQDSIEMQFDHKLLKTSQERGMRDEETYKEALAFAQKASRADGMDRVMDAHNLDAIIAPSGSPAWIIDPVNGDTFGVFSSSPAAISGYPNITVPMGQLGGLPVGVSIFGRAWSESILIEIAYSYEQSTKHRFTPNYFGGKDK